MMQSVVMTKRRRVRQIWTRSLCSREMVAKKISKIVVKDEDAMQHAWVDLFRMRVTPWELLPMNSGLLYLTFDRNPGMLTEKGKGDFSPGYESI